MHAGFWQEELPDGNEPLGRPRRRWEEDIKMNLQKM
jgi:hypothetical protein